MFLSVIYVKETMSNDLAEFPLDDYILEAILDSFKGSFEVDEEGNHTLVGGDFTFHGLLNLLSGYDESKLIPYEDEMFHTYDDTFIYPDNIYSERDVIIALIEEVRRLREQRP